MAETAKVIELFGNKYKKTEAAETIIKFPGGSISVCRTSNNEYWAHIEVNHGQAGPDIGGIRETKHGRVVDSRIDYADDVVDMPRHQEIQHLAVRIQTT